MSGMEWSGAAMAFLVVYLLFRDFQIERRVKLWIEALDKKINEKSEEFKDYLDRRMDAHIATHHESGSGNPVEDFDDDDFEEDDSGSYSGELDDEDGDDDKSDSEDFDDDAPGGKEDFGG
jgi:hypothetical protein